jgi:putative nucleotidyltransferase with HDIG domain
MAKNGGTEKMEAAIRPGTARAETATRPVGEGHGRRLTRALEALEVFPALAESRDRLLRLVGESQPSIADMVSAVESDPALAISVLRLANHRPGPRGGKVTSIRDGVELLGPAAVEGLAERVDVFDFFERTPTWDVAPERFRLHAVAVQRAADRIAREVDHIDRDEVLVAALLHDIGKLVLVQAYPGYPGQVHGDARTPETRLRAERRELGVDHALVGGVLARRWELPSRLASTIERHHADDAVGETAVVRLADMLAHYVNDQPVDPSQLLQTARAVGLDRRRLRSILYELPFGTMAERRHIDPCPLSARELEILKRLAEGKVYKQIAVDLSLSTSTVRTHLHNTYAKLGAVDRAQAVLLATQRGWL